MTHAEFHRAAGAHAGGKYYSTRVEVSTEHDGSHSFEFQIYRREHGWTPNFATAEECLASLVSSDGPPKPENQVESCGDVAADLMAKNLLDAERI